MTMLMSVTLLRHQHHPVPWANCHRQRLLPLEQSSGMFHIILIICKLPNSIIQVTNDRLFYVLSPIPWASWTYTVLSYFCPSEDSAIWLPCFIACQWCCTLIIQIKLSPLQLEPKALPIQGHHIIDTLTLVLTYQQGYKQDLIKTSLRSFNTVWIL